MNKVTMDFELEDLYVIKNLLQKSIINNKQILCMYDHFMSDEYMKREHEDILNNVNPEQLNNDIMHQNKIIENICRQI